jgi:hypothetical protein
MRITLLKLSSGNFLIGKKIYTGLTIVIDASRPLPFSKIIVGQGRMQTILESAKGRAGNKVKRILRSLRLGLSKPSEQRLKYHLLLCLPQVHLYPTTKLLSPLLKNRTCFSQTILLKRMDGTTEWCFYGVNANGLLCKAELNL